GRPKSPGLYSYLTRTAGRPRGRDGGRPRRRIAGREGLPGTLVDEILASGARAMLAAEDRSAALDAVADHSTRAMTATGSQTVDGALEAVEDVVGAVRERHAERLFVGIATDHAAIHVEFLLRDESEQQEASQRPRPRARLARACPSERAVI